MPNPVISDFNLTQWDLCAPKTKGANNAGKLGGLYQPKNSTYPAYFLKQDPKQDKNISEVLSAQFMRGIAQDLGLNPDLIADVKFVQIAASKPNKPPKIYVASKIYANFSDLHIDAYLALFNLAEYRPLKDSKGFQQPKALKGRPGFLKHDKIIEAMMLAGRYPNLSHGMAMRAIVDDPDTHFENIGVIPLKSADDKAWLPLYQDSKITGWLCSQEPSGKMPYRQINTSNNQQFYLVEDKADLIKFEKSREMRAIQINQTIYLLPNFDNTYTTHIDFGGAFGDFRWPLARKFDHKIHLNRLHNLFRYLPSRNAPPAYINHIAPALLDDNLEFYTALAGFAMMDGARLQHQLRELVQALIIYERQPLIVQRFAKRIGISTVSSNFSVNLKQIECFLLEQLRGRQQHVYTLFLHYLCSLSFTKQHVILNQLNDDSAKHLAQKKVFVSFLYKLKHQEPYLFAGFDCIARLTQDINNFAHQDLLINIQEQLQHQLSQAYIHRQLIKTYYEQHQLIELLIKFIRYHQNTIHALKHSHLSCQEKTVLLDELLHRHTLFEHQLRHQLTFKSSFSIKITTLSMTLAGILLGVILGCMAGAILGGIMGSLLGILTVGSAVALMSGIQGGVIGSILGSVAGLVIPDQQKLYERTQNKTRYLFFKYQQSSVYQLTQTLSQDISSIRLR